MAAITPFLREIAAMHCPSPLSSYICIKEKTTFQWRLAANHSVRSLGHTNKQNHTKNSAPWRHFLLKCVDFKSVFGCLFLEVLYCTINCAFCKSDALSNSLRKRLVWISRYIYFKNTLPMVPMVPYWPCESDMLLPVRKGQGLHLLIAHVKFMYPLNLSDKLAYIINFPVDMNGQMSTSFIFLCWNKALNLF